MAVWSRIGRQIHGENGQMSEGPPSRSEFKQRVKFFCVSWADANGVHSFLLEGHMDDSLDSAIARLRLLVAECRACAHHRRTRGCFGSRIPVGDSRSESRATVDGGCAVMSVAAV